MPPKKKAASSAPAPLPSPNLSHPCASLLPSVLTSISAGSRTHPASYHTFLDSPFYPSGTSTSSSERPAKKRKKVEQPPLPPLLEGAIGARVLQEKLCGWFETVKDNRQMGWRKEVDPASLTAEERSQRGYEVWVSEIMLQQTQVVTVISYWKNWMEKFPTVADLAAADIEDVNGVWAGLGYYSRAKRLLDGAKTVMNEHDGLLPETVEGLLKIDGVGPYTAGAISSIAFAARSPLVDGNVQRVLSRLTAFHAPAAGKPTTNFLWALANVLVPAQPSTNEDEDAAAPTSSPHFKKKEKTRKRAKNFPGAWNQALMELGATVCTPKNPKCEVCPISNECLAHAEARYVAHSGASSSTSTAPPPPLDIEDLCTLCSPLPTSTAHHTVEVYPMAKERAKKKEEETAVMVVEWVKSGEDKNAEDDEGRKVLLFKRPEKGLLAGLFEFPAVDLPSLPAPSTPKSRSSHLNALLPTLLDVPKLSFLLSAFSSSSSASSTKNGVTILSCTLLPEVKHVYSHKNVLYHPTRLVLSSPSLPTLHTASSAPSLSLTDDDNDEELLRSLPGRGKWVDAKDVETSNIGGAVGKVWEERGRAVRGEPVGEKGKGTGKKAVSGGKKKQGEKEKGQGSLVGFFGVRGKAAKAAEKSDDDDLIIVEEETVQKSRVSSTSSSKKAGSGKRVVAGVVKEKVEEKVVKKRVIARIAPSSDEDE